MQNPPGLLGETALIKTTLEPPLVQIAKMEALSTYG
jgi:hypothetical protein